jgi:hypothetical protein
MPIAAGLAASDHLADPLGRSASGKLGVRRERHNSRRRLIACASTQRSSRVASMKK